MFIQENITMVQSNNITIGVGDMIVSNDPNTTLVTYSLGSCLGIMVYDPQAKVGGLLHAMLPEAKDEKNSGNFNPYKYVDSGVPLLFKETYKYGAKKTGLGSLLPEALKYSMHPVFLTSVKGI